MQAHNGAPRPLSDLTPNAKRHSIVAVDPGTKASAFVILSSNVDYKARNASDLFICKHGILPNQDLLLELNQPKPFTNLMHGKPPSVLVIENIQAMGMPVGQETLDTMWWIGRFCQAWTPRAFSRVNRSAVKMHLCGSARAKDPNIRQRLIDRFGAQGTKRLPGATYGLKTHTWSALAVAITWLETEQTSILDSHCWKRK